MILSSYLIFYTQDLKLSKKKSFDILITWDAKYSLLVSKCMNRHTGLLTYLKFTSDLPNTFTEGTNLSIQLLYIFTKNITKIKKKILHFLNS